MPAEVPHHEMVIPTLEIEQAVAPLCKEILEVASQAEAANILNPVTTFWRLKKVSRQRERLRPRYDAVVADCHGRLVEPVTGGPGFMLGWAQVWATAKGTSALLKLQSTWAELQAIIDRKYAYTFGVLSLYVAVISLIATFLLPVLSGKG